MKDLNVAVIYKNDYMREKIVEYLDSLDKGYNVKGFMTALDFSSYKGKLGFVIVNWSENDSETRDCH